MKGYSQFDTTGLYYFSVVAEEMSVSRAAERLLIAQSAISRRIMALEDHLGVKLFVRHPRGVDLTEAGETLLQNAYALFRHIENLRENTSAVGNALRGVVTIGTVPTPGEYIIPKFMAKVRAEYPDIKCRIVEGYSADLLRMLNDQEINIALMHAPVAQPDIETQELLLNYMCLVGPPGSLKKKSYAFKEAAAFPLILPSSPNLVRMRLDQIAQERGITFNEAIRCQGFWLIKAMVREGLGYTIVTFGSVVTDLEQGLLDVAVLKEPAVPWGLVLANRAEQANKLSLIAVKQLLGDVVSELQSRDIWHQLPAKPSAETPPEE
ncbi:LysR family transcriptional regulator [Martelella mediterranea]|uniref:Cyn operon transcriptional activator n=1 Tax=Martelella mediterranea DSM 17316 TaxID=1122214 RepID=A0A1U9YVW3_9HYPH|nr:LysR family transcriptional regulator [Martelella mediterranea]AQZ49576.1 Cyn operon transcriptional activator [Martelella mediterranea DSM 17316]